MSDMRLFLFILVHSFTSLLSIIGGGTETPLPLSFSYQDVIGQFAKKGLALAYFRGVIQQTSTKTFPLI